MLHAASGLRIARKHRSHVVSTGGIETARWCTMGHWQDRRYGSESSPTHARQRGTAADRRRERLHILGHLFALAGLGVCGMLPGGARGEFQAPDAAPRGRSDQVPARAAPAPPQNARSPQGATQESATSKPAQPPNAADSPAATQDTQAEPGAAGALSIRYRFRESYSVNPDPAHPERVSEYEVGMRQKFRTVVDMPQGAPDRQETFYQTIYVEHAAKVSDAGDLMAALRRYDKYSMKGPEAVHPSKIPLFQGLTILAQARRDRVLPEIVSLTEDRPVRELEYRTMQGQVSFPVLRVLLPATPRRVGDTWTVPPRAAFPLLGESPETEDFDLNATLLDVRRPASVDKLTAVFGISGQVRVPAGLVRLNAEMQFAFKPAPAETPPATKGESAPAREKAQVDPSAKTSGKFVEAPGWITELRMAREVTTPLPEADGRLKETATYELIMARRTLDAAAEAAARTPGVAPPAPIQVPDPLPSPTETNTWLVYEDPSVRFYFRHPQDLDAEPNAQDNPDVLTYIHEQARLGTDRLSIFLPPKDADPKLSLEFHDPERFRNRITRDWAAKKVELLPGPSGWLPEADWSNSKRKVYRMEVGIKSTGGIGGSEGRVIIDYYLVDFGRGRSIMVESWTNRDDHVGFVRQVEGVIRSFAFGPWLGPTGEKAVPPETPPAPR
jgi:hypothetical protein